MHSFLHEFKRKISAFKSKYKDVSESSEKAENKLLESQSSSTVMTPSVSHNSAGKR